MYPRRVIPSKEKPFLGAMIKRNKVKHIEPARVCRILEEIAMNHIDGTDSAFDKFAGLVYMYCHITSATCINSHGGWVKDFQETEKEILDWWEDHENRRIDTLEAPLAFVEKKSGEYIE